MADPKAPGSDLKALDTRLRDLERRIRDKEVPSGTQKNLTTEKVLQAIADLQEQAAILEQQQAAIQAVQTQQADQIAYLASLTVNTAKSNLGITTFGPGWAPNNDLRPSVSVRTSTGKLRITVSATIGNAFVVYSIPGHVTRDSLVAGTGLFDALVAGADVNHTFGSSRQFIATGLPTNTTLTVTAEPYSTISTGFAARVGIAVEVIP